MILDCNQLELVYKDSQIKHILVDIQSRLQILANLLLSILEELLLLDNPPHTRCSQSNKLCRHLSRLIYRFYSL